MMIDKMLLIIEVVAILFGAGTRAHPVYVAEKPSSHIAISMVEADKPISGDIEEGFCVQPKSDFAKKFKVDSILNCAPKKSSWTLSHLNSVKAVEDVIMHKDLPGLLRLKRAIERRMPRKAIRQYPIRKYRKIGNYRKLE